jgi:hypothetical protein
MMAREGKEEAEVEKRRGFDDVADAAGAAQLLVAGRPRCVWRRILHVAARQSLVDDDGEFAMLHPRCVYYCLAGCPWQLKPQKQIWKSQSSPEVLD